MIAEFTHLLRKMAASKKSSSSPSDYLFSLVWIGTVLYGVAFFLQNAYNIRLQAINEYGRVIHEFDPYFNWRATQYLYENGAKKFFRWFDHMVWYPLVSSVEERITVYSLSLSRDPQFTNHARMFAGKARWNHYLSWYAIHRSIHQELHCWRQNVVE